MWGPEFNTASNSPVNSYYYMRMLYRIDSGGDYNHTTITINNN